MKERVIIVSQNKVECKTTSTPLLQIDPQINYVIQVNLFELHPTSSEISAVMHLSV